MKNGMVIIDADGHAVDYEPVYRERLPEKYRQRATIYPADNFDRTQNGALAGKRPPSPAQNLADNAQEGIDLQIIYPTGGLMLTRVRERDYAIALCQAYNDWLYDWCAIDRRRLKAVALVPLHVDTRAAIDEMERAVSKLGNVGVMVNTYDRSRNIAHRDFWPFYEECARQGVPVAFHASGSDTMDPLCHFENFLQIHTLSHAPEQLIACTAVIYSGLLEKYQDLRVAFLEAGIGWVPFWMEHMDEEYEFRQFDAPLLEGQAVGIHDLRPRIRVLRAGREDLALRARILPGRQYPVRLGLSALGRPVPRCRFDPGRPHGHRGGGSSARSSSTTRSAFTE